MTACTKTHRSLARTIRIAHPVDKVFPLLTPEGERAWVDGWSPIYLSTNKNKERTGTVFRTEHGGETTIWTIVAIDQVALRSSYIRHTEGSRTGLVRVHCQADGQGTIVEICYDITALSPAGRDSVLEFEANFAAAIDGWAPAIAAALESPPT